MEVEENHPRLLFSLRRQMKDEPSNIDLCSYLLQLHHEDNITNKCLGRLQTI